MKKFKDCAGRDWTLDVNCASLKRVRKMLDVDLTQLDQGNPPLCLQLERDPVLVCDVLYVLLEPDVKAANLTDEDFGKGLGKEGLKEGRKALAEELTDFFQQLGLKEQVTLLQTQSTFMDKVRSRSVSRLEKLDLDALINTAEQQAQARLTAQNRPSGNESTSLPDSSASTPTLTASAP